MSSITNHFTEAQNILAQFIADEKNISAVEKAGIIMAEAVCNGKKIIGYGNGGRRNFRVVRWALIETDDLK